MFCAQMVGNVLCVMMPLHLQGKSNKIKERVSLMCHQCQRNDKSGVVHCSKCKAKRFCYECIERW